MSDVKDISATREIMRLLVSTINGAPGLLVEPAGSAFEHGFSRCDFRVRINPGDPPIHLAVLDIYDEQRRTAKSETKPIPEPKKNQTPQRRRGRPAASGGGFDLETS